MLTNSYLQGVEPPPRRPRCRCGETPSPLEKAIAQLKRKRRRITNSAGVPAGTCICCTHDPTNSGPRFRVRDETGLTRGGTGPGSTVVAGPPEALGVASQVRRHEPSQGGQVVAALLHDDGGYAGASQQRTRSPEPLLGDGQRALGVLGRGVQTERDDHRRTAGGEGPADQVADR